jgi:hypothetical protein
LCGARRRAGPLGDEHWCRWRWSRRHRKVCLLVGRKRNCTWRARPQQALVRGLARRGQVELGGGCPGCCDTPRRYTSREATCGQPVAWRRVPGSEARLAPVRIALKYQSLRSLLSIQRERAARKGGRRSWV